MKKVTKETLQRTTLVVNSPCHRSGILLEEGQQYIFEAFEKDPLYDASIKSPGPEGFSSNYPKKWFTKIIMYSFALLRRRRCNKWFALIGGVLPDSGSEEKLKVNSELFFLIGNGNKVEARATGEFVYFVNDVPSKYDNNKGSIEITIKIAEE